MYPNIKTSSALTVVIADKPYSITTDHTNYEEVLYLIHHHPTLELDDTLLELIKPVKKFKRIIGSDSTGFRFEDDQLRCYIDDQPFPLSPSLYEEIINVHNAAGNLSPLYNFVVKLAKNPRKEVIDELWGFLSACGLAITESGNFLAYKRVRSDFLSIYDRKTDNSPGTIVQMPRYAVEHDPSKTCSAGLHFAAWSYLSSYASAHQNKTVILSISPEDVVSIPTDYNNAKGRAWRYEVLREVERDDELCDYSVYTDIGDPFEDYYDEVDIYDGGIYRLEAYADYLLDEDRIELYDAKQNYFVTAYVSDINFDQIKASYFSVV